MSSLSLGCGWICRTLLDEASWSSSDQSHMTRGAPGGVGFDVARTPDGTVWNDLPYLATDMTAFWNNECAAMSTSQRVNASSFLAKLASARVANDRLCLIALILFRDTLETSDLLGVPTTLMMSVLVGPCTC